MEERLMSEIFTPSISIEEALRYSVEARSFTTLRS